VSEAENRKWKLENGNWKIEKRCTYIELRIARRSSNFQFLFSSFKFPGLLD